MAPLSVLLFFLFSHLPFLYSAETSKYPSPCPNFKCGKLGDIRFPFTPATNPACGLLKVNCSDHKIQLQRRGRWYKVENISEADTISISDSELQNHLDKERCDFFEEFSTPRSRMVSFQFVPNITLFKCNRSFNSTHGSGFSYDTTCNNSLYFNHTNGSNPSFLPHSCSTILLPGLWVRNHNHYDIKLKFQARVYVSLECSSCHFERGGQCEIKSNGDFFCANARRPAKGGQKWGWRQTLALVLGLAAIMVISPTIILIWCRYERKYSSSNFIPSNNSYDPSTKSEIEGGSVYSGVPIFPYTEVEEATSNFDSQKELGDGGFGAVYYGKLQDGREVAVKRLYDHNYKRVKQFLNEIEILRRLHHRNLVSLYGCTSLCSRELLLIYEYVPNGTVADHLHGDRAKSGSLTWPIRMRIAIETASALAYLHASDIIHRDVKTDNILLDNDFSVKVADFGLSRLFPIDATHISTAPQGTAGYVDPEYYYCYQLTDKSDVYSFGVVLVELISSIPAVDITRHRDEINLANLAKNKIQRCEFDELIDPSLGYKLDKEVKRMTTSVAELAFLCLQQGKEMRPSMDDVLEQLQRIESGEYALDSLEE
ncbi:LEAF RUST 10 DISEASE-RESISTANCE LOCUS RECEPTOR-LIKE PROTEIN KINASE-like 1.1 isoform X2 [Hevea brasiliensis]|uniref:LEAF RUST 10 DISEASE-RESISTANCE LOCUS RECEPTOR-LIKE PROTEIN KINASE-like 1.1 isoform X2 n=1 Tax=Hevea brasiliensis TaxID=3981 RepID=UPI0025FA207E|nr:LEAF RUST 10 DISEASE-RESISTANCE LOCUS RECEPTOR-LIKE PROTEIN KINASE-like 1.1 isoform X2 [Hevea brasiliensis]